MTDNRDFFRDESLVPDPYPFLAGLRERCPVQREPHQNVVMVTGYDEAVAVCGDAETFSSATSVTGPFPGFPVALEGHSDQEVSDLIDRHRAELPMSDQITTFDPPTHTEHRALLMGLITPKRLKQNEDFMWRLADQTLEPYLTRGGGEFISEFAGPFTLLVIADLLGVPEDDRDEFAARMGGHDQAGIGSTAEQSVQQNPLEYLYEKFSAYIAERRANPREDTLTEMAAAKFPDGSTPEVIDVVRLAANLYLAGQETTVRLLSSALKLLAERQDLQDLLRAEPARIPNFIEEALRWESPIKGDFRLARSAATVGGVDVPAGATLMVCNGAANRDPRQFENPDTFDVDRPNARRHIAFGRGVHSCPGAPLARAEARVCLERILARTSQIRLSEAEHGPEGDRRFDYVPTYILRGLTVLHLEVTPR
ncbi:cytochrome P450 [Mycolicibacterium septicum]|uniref:Cytochrome P450 n=1 Tax=Mycolicibacterium septicum TaxID=98668 RepID=A0ABW9M4Z3_9MYCO